MICFVCNIEREAVFLDEPDHICSICGAPHMKKSKIPTEHNHEIGYASNFHLEDVTAAEHISICPGQEIYSDWDSRYLEISGYICTTYKYPYQYKEESPCLWHGTTYIGKNKKHKIN